MSAEKSWSTFYRLAGALALLIALAGLTDAFTSLGAEARANSAVPAASWLALFASAPFAAFSRLGVFNLITVSLGIPVFVALGRALGVVRPARAALAATLFLCGAAVYLASNPLFGLFALSQAAAAPGANRAAIEAAAGALLARGADLTPGTFVGLALVQVAGVLAARTLAARPAFGRWAGRLGQAGFGVMLVFFFMAAFFPAAYAAALLVSAPGGLLLVAYQGLLARGFFRLARQPQEG